MRRELCACGAAIVVPMDCNREFLEWSLRAHYRGERHAAWSRARIDPNFGVPTGYNRLGDVTVAKEAVAGPAPARRSPRT